MTEKLHSIETSHTRNNSRRRHDQPLSKLWPGKAPRPSLQTKWFRTTCCVAEGCRRDQLLPESYLSKPSGTMIGIAVNLLNIIGSCNVVFLLSVLCFTNHSRQRMTPHLAEERSVGLVASTGGTLHNCSSDVFQSASSIASQVLGFKGSCYTARPFYVDDISRARCLELGHRGTWLTLESRRLHKIISHATTSNCRRRIQRTGSERLSVAALLASTWQFAKKAAVNIGHNATLCCRAEQ